MNIFEIFNAFHIASIRLRVVILYEVEGNGKEMYIYIFIFGAAESGTIVSAIKDQKNISLKKMKVNKIYFS